MLLLELGYDVHWVGRLLPNSVPLDRTYTTTRLRLFFKKGGLFYAEFQVRLFFFLLRNRASVVLSNDLDTLLARCCGFKLIGDEITNMHGS